MRGRLSAVDNAVNKGDGSFRYTIPKPAADELGLEGGEEPAVEWDAEAGELTLAFK